MGLITKTFKLAPGALAGAKANIHDYIVKCDIPSNGKLIKYETISAPGRQGYELHITYEDGKK